MVVRIHASPATRWATLYPPNLHPLTALCLSSSSKEPRGTRHHRRTELEGLSAGSHCGACHGTILGHQQSIASRPKARGAGVRPAFRLCIFTSTHWRRRAPLFPSPNDRQPSFPTHLLVHVSCEPCRRPFSRPLDTSRLDIARLQRPDPVRHRCQYLGPSLGHDSPQANLVRPQTSPLCAAGAHPLQHGQVALALTHGISVIEPACCIVCWLHSCRHSFEASMLHHKVPNLPTEVPTFCLPTSLLIW